VNAWPAPQATGTAPLGLIEPPVPALAVIVFASSSRMVAVAVAGTPTVAFVAPVNASENVSFGSQRVSQTTFTGIVPLVAPAGMTIDPVADW